MKEGQTTRNEIRDDELTLRDLVMTFQKYRREAFRRWWLYGIAVLLFGGFMVYRAVSTPETYKARLTFMVNEEDGNPFGGISGVLGQFGLGRGRGGKFNLDKIIELARSRRIIQEVLLTQEGGDYIGNRLIAEYELDAQWAAGDPELEGFRFTHDSIAIFNKHERMALLSLHALLIGGEDAEGIAKAAYDDISGILSLTCETTNEQLAIDITTTQFDALSKFYIDQAIERQLQTFNLVRAKVDSIQSELSKNDIGLASFMDASQSMFSKVDRLKEGRLQREISKLAAMLAEAVKNMEYAEFSLKSAKPVIQDLDLPMSPLTPIKPSLFKAILIGGAIAFLLVTGFIVGRQVLKEAMEE
jgi:uncharacterized protein involved in exopolysaccharide biosynthesis